MSWKNFLFFVVLLIIVFAGGIVIAQAPSQPATPAPSGTTVKGCDSQTILGCLSALDKLFVEKLLKNHVPENKQAGSVKEFSDSTSVEGFDKYLAANKYSVVVFMCADCLGGEGKGALVKKQQDDFGSVSATHSGKIGFASINPTANIDVAKKYGVDGAGPVFIVFEKTSDGIKKVRDSKNNFLSVTPLDNLIPAHMKK